ncbi:hypothetical protein EVAR_23138_1 [Eumeta japonica]|uniref:Uncharacterized protein n=1 Tax=Eumeta variegata TaxID=151549 RepID=A0A4C1VBA6_EUMVA|nr:hypothetical protein EVAR_23138_1 [Eumeta japonica]
MKRGRSIWELPCAVVASRLPARDAGARLVGEERADCTSLTYSCVACRRIALRFPLSEAADGRETDSIQTFQRQRDLIAPTAPTYTHVFSENSPRPQRAHNANRRCRMHPRNGVPRLANSMANYVNILGGARTRNNIIVSLLPGRGCAASWATMAPLSTRREVVVFVAYTGLHTNEPES